jgi:UDP-N-acetylmuramoyl-tripeptide--D-alanyl-D-alanine ligase
MAATVTDSTRPSAAPAADAFFDGQGIAVAAAGVLLRSSGRPVRGGAVDSRRVEPGNAFFALSGDRTDGHRFLRDAAARGAAALVVSRDLPGDELDELAALADGGVAIVRVPDSLRALHAVAGAWRSRFAPLVVGVTGSVGKTSTKEAVATVLAARWHVLRSEGNENNEIGLPLTLLRLDRSHDVAVVEMGMYVAGEIAELAAIARPGVGVVTAVRGVHLERAGSIDEIERGKGQLVEALPDDGAAVLNGDDPRVRRMASRTRARAVTYGFDPGNDVVADAVEPAGAEGSRFVLRTGARTTAFAPAASAVRLPVPGRHSVENALAAAAVGLVLGLDSGTIVAGLERGWSAAHRTQLIRAGGWLLLDDSYNAGPDSMMAALDLLTTLPGRHVAVLGEMLELGPDASALHHEVGRHAAGRADLVVVVGDGARPIAGGAREAGMPPELVVEVPDRAAALARLRSLLAAGDTVLFKGSRGAALDELVAAVVDLAALAGERS